eukprot:Trichotokara_eunicae@DN5083_c0_g1_i5.p1
MTNSIGGSLGQTHTTRPMKTTTTITSGIAKTFSVRTQGPLISASQGLVGTMAFPHTATITMPPQSAIVSESKPNVFPPPAGMPHISEWPPEQPPMEIAPPVYPMH